MSEFIRGMGTILTIFPLEKDKPTISLPKQSFEEAIRSDWEAVGHDLLTAASEIDSRKNHCEVD